MKLTRDTIEHVTNEAHAWHMHQLERYGNKPNHVQRTILKALMQMFSDMVVGTVVGRFPWPLATGLGKTTAIIAYHRTLEALQVEGVSTATAASQVEALCRLYRDMQASGVPKEKIGLLHSKKYDHKRPDLWKISSEYASEPATSDNGTRPYVLVTQERVKDKDKYREYFYFDGKPRNFLTWDESILATDYWKLTLNSVKGATATLMGLSQDEPELLGMYQGFKRQSEFLLRELKLATVRKKTRHCTPPTVPLEAIEEWKALASENRFRGLLHQGTRPCLPFFNQSLRVYPLKESGGLVWYTPAIPSEEEIPSMIILDASFPIRELEKADTTLKRVDETVQVFVDGEVTFTDAKRYDHVVIHQWCRHSGRDAMHKDFFGVKNESADPRAEWLAQRMAEQSVARRTAKVAATLPREEAMLFFVFKPDQMGQDEYRRVLEAKLQREGVDLTATVPVLEYNQDGTPVIVNKPRVNILTFGQETSLNDFSHVQNVFLVGMLHRDELDVLGQYVAQCDGGKHENLEQQQAQRLVQSEIIHTIYQAISRGSCRVTENGQARPMKAWIIHYSKAIRKPLETVTPGVQWVDDWTQDSEVEASSKKVSKPLDPLALKLREHLEGMLPEMFPRFAGHVKGDVGMTSLSRKVWKRIVEEAIEETEYRLENKSFVKTSILAPSSTLLG